MGGIGSGRQAEALACPDGGQGMESRGRKLKRVLTILGAVPYRRTRLECADCGRTVYPGDELLDIEGTTRSPGLRRLMARAGSKELFKEGRDDLKE